MFETCAGVDILGNKLTPEERVITGVMILVPVVGGAAVRKVWRAGKGAVNATEVVIDETATGATRTIYRAPHKGCGASEIGNGYDPKNFADPGGNNCAHFTPDPALAKEYTQYGNYEDFIVEIEIPENTYIDELAPLEEPFPGRPGTQLPVPHDKFHVLNSAHRRQYE